MNHDEQLAHTYLSSRFASVIHEPDGNIPPDFLVDGRIAVEVRRLNQHTQNETNPRGLEEDAFPLNAKFIRLLASFGPPRDGRSWYVSFSFQRPPPPW